MKKNLIKIMLSVCLITATMHIWGCGGEKSYGPDATGEGGSAGRGMGNK